MCPNDPDGKDVVETGGLDSFFERMVHEAEIYGFSPTVLSRPLAAVADGVESCGEDDVLHPCVPDGPWVITLENFVTPEEVEKLKDWGTKFEYVRSQAGDEVTDVRTSSQTWCNDECYDDPLVVDMRQRIVQVTSVPEENYESMQLLKYEEGQFYRTHNDFILKHTEQAHGPRMITFFCYFDAVKKGGGTRFPKLNNLTVEPAQGRVLIWPSVLNEDVYDMDRRTDHEALAVEEGQKFAANIWIHLRDFQTPFKAGCPG